METTSAKVGTPADIFFKRRMQMRGWNIYDNETVVEFILRKGFPFSITYEDVRDDN